MKGRFWFEKDGSVFSTRFRKNENVGLENCSE